MMNLEQAIASLRPGVEWSMSNNDVENIIWHTPNVQPLTLNEVLDEIERLKSAAAAAEAEREAEEATKAAARQSAINKLAALGLTPEEAAAIVGG